MENRLPYLELFDIVLILWYSILCLRCKYEYDKLELYQFLPLKNIWNICDMIMYATNPIIIEYIFCGFISYSLSFSSSPILVILISSSLVAARLTIVICKPPRRSVSPCLGT